MSSSPPHWAGRHSDLLGPLVARWFLKRRALALSLLMAISTMGSIFSPPIAGLVLAFYSWRETLMVSGAILLLLALPLAWKLLRNWPSESGRRLAANSPYICPNQPKQLVFARFKISRPSSRSVHKCRFKSC